MVQEKTHLLLQIASEAVEDVFAKRGEIMPTVCIPSSDDKTVNIMPAPVGSKNEAAALMRAYFLLNDTKRYIFIDEAWRLDLRGVSEEEMATLVAFCNEYGVSAHPRRIETVMFSAEDELGHINGFRVIERKGRKARLGPLVLDPEGGTYEGRFVGLLPKRGRTQ